MSRALAAALGIGAGCLVGMQAPVNARLSGAIGKVPAATFSFLVGTAALLVVVGARGELSGFGHVGRAPWWALIGGLFGAVYVTVALATVRTLGASGLTAVVIAGQLVISVVIDRYGLLGIPKQHIDATRILGLLLLVAGVVLVVRK